MMVVYMKYDWLIISLACFFCSFSSLRHATASASDEKASVVIETKYGKIEGDVVEVEVDAKADGKDSATAAVFKGIRYGTAERFQKPQPVQPWTGTKQAKSWGSRCPQHQFMGVHEPTVAEDISEDCLYLNVFAPYPTKPGNRLPVMVFIHGGGLAAGSSTEYGQDGIVEWFLPKGVVFVTLNYRLGPFGFFSTGAGDGSGNYGYWDQTLALRWIRENIDRFGGDPNRVTVFGESAGAISVSVLTLSPHSRDLFQRSILMSGSAFVPGFSGGRDSNSVELSEWMTNKLGCGSFKHKQKESGNDDDESKGKKKRKKKVLECVKSKPIADILELANSLDPKVDFLKTMWATVVDGDFLPEPIEQLHRVAPPKPTIIGTTREEAGGFVTPPLPADIETHWIIDDYASFTLDKFQHHVRKLFGDYDARADLRLALDHYVDSVGDRRNTTFLVEKFKEILSDWMFVVPAYKEAIRNRNRGSPVWLYSFDYYDHAVFLNDQKRQGPYHFLDMPYLFKWQNRFHPSPWRGNDLKIAHLFTTLLTNFAIHGHPTPESSPLRRDFDWAQITDEHPYRYLRLDLNPNVEEYYDRRGISFWLELLPDLAGAIGEQQSEGAKKSKQGGKSEL